MDYTWPNNQICVEQNRLHMGKCPNRQRYVVKKMDYTWEDV